MNFILQFFFCSGKEENGMTISRLVSYLMQIAEGMMFLHSKVTRQAQPMMVASY